MQPWYSRNIAAVQEIPLDFRQLHSGLHAHCLTHAFRGTRSQGPRAKSCCKYLPQNHIRWFLGKQDATGLAKAQAGKPEDSDAIGSFFLVESQTRRRCIFRPTESEASGDRERGRGLSFHDLSLPCSRRSRGITQHNYSQLDFGAVTRSAADLERIAGKPNAPLLTANAAMTPMCAAAARARMQCCHFFDCPI